MMENGLAKQKKLNVSVTHEVTGLASTDKNCHHMQNHACTSRK